MSIKAVGTMKNEHGARRTCFTAECDGPGCSETVTTSPWGDHAELAEWSTLNLADDGTYWFHDPACIKAWAAAWDGQTT